VKRASSSEPAAVLDDASIGLEGRLSSDDHMSLKLWLRLLSCSTQVETEIRRRLRTRFGTTLSRFDYLAQLHRHPEGLRMNALSRYLMVTGGSITGLTDELEKEGLVARHAAPDDRRSFLLKLTPEGRQTFDRIAAEHEAWIVEMFSDLRAADRATLFDLLGQLRIDMTARQARSDSPTSSLSEAA
jgi:DNA-binding MarR family transcriptional regulator